MVDASHAAERRRTILDAAVKLFDSQGYAATTIDEIAAGAGISKGSVYNYFKGKSDLFNQLFADAFAPDEASVSRMIQELPSARDKIGEYIDLWCRRLPHYMQVGRLTLEFWATAARGRQGDELAEMLQQMQDHWLKRLAAVIAEGIAAGEFGTRLDPTAVAALIHGVMDGLLLHMILGVSVEVDEQFADSLKQSVFAILAGREPGDAGADDKSGDDV